TALCVARICFNQDVEVLGSARVSVERDRPARRIAHPPYEAPPRCRESRRRARSCAGSWDEADRNVLARVRGRLQPREAKALNGEARCERDRGGSPDWREVHFTAAKLGLVKNHHLGAFYCPLLPCSFRGHAPSVPFRPVG